jgi:ribonuclease BN (tRNA processing enzyme)
VLQSQAKGDSLRNNTAPIHIYGPQGLARYLQTMLTTSDTCICVPIIVFELIPAAVDAHKYTPQCINHRARLHSVRALSIRMFQNIP